MQTQKHSTPQIYRHNLYKCDYQRDFTIVHGTLARCIGTVDTMILNARCMPINLRKETRDLLKNKIECEPYASESILNKRKASQSQQ